ncbi:hypothetical protein IWX84_003099 [Flavobacterium sp. CG_9.10]|uniref:DUF6629 family protein n=1 Tax=Flavobacterium sp. CG_9.10 TaxID=2787729 RepID=UPI0018C9104D|nr:DUF6629 family protein [Flavobacterium sp. CG_9.10]MBG6112196.1 hypothetical protein [Flavobacterium sp. CG_9.10]
MCFSASISFGAGIILAAVSVISIQQVRKPYQIYFACIPIIFCAQQFVEGFLWLALTKPFFAPLQQITTYILLFISQFVWPIWIPYAALKLEKEQENIIFQRVLLAIGVFIAFYMGYCLMTYAVEAKISGYTISFSQNYPMKYSIPADLLYIIATIAPPLFLNIRKVWLLAVTTIISYTITTLYYENYIVSVWSFFSLIIAASILVIMDEIRYPTKKNSKYYYSSERSKNTRISTPDI